MMTTRTFGEVEFPPLGVGDAPPRLFHHHITSGMIPDVLYVARPEGEMGTNSS